jgi:hypothetical protein
VRPEIEIQNRLNTSMGLRDTFKTPPHDKHNKPIPVSEHRSDQSAMTLTQSFVDATLMNLLPLG